MKKDNVVELSGLEQLGQVAIDPV